MPKIKVLHIIKSLGRGGAEMLLPETLKLHSQEKFEFHYIYFLPWKNQMVGAIEDGGGKVICFSASNNIKLLKQYPKVIKYCNDIGINLIHCHLPWSGFLGRIIHARTKIPMIYTEHNIQERYHFTTNWLNRFSFNFQTVAIGVSKDVSRSIKENINPEIPVHTVLNGVNTELFRKNESKGLEIKVKYNIPEEALVVGNIAVFREQKGLDDWVKAFDKISRARPDVYGLLVGAGPKEEEIASLVRKLKLTDKIKLAGLQTDTVSYFSAMDIFMMSSKFEGLPIALLEAMSMNCAVISTRAGGVVEVIEDGRNGMLCEVGDWGCLAERALSLISSENKRIKFQSDARERVINSFSLQNMVESLEEIYKLNLNRNN